MSIQTSQRVSDNPTEAGHVVQRPAVSTLRAWISVLILVVFVIFSVIDRQVISLLIAPIKADLKLSDTQIGLLQGVAFAIFYSAAGIPLGWAADRLPRRLVIYCGISLWSLSAGFCGLASSFWQLFAARTVVGVGEAALSPSANSLIGDLFPRDRVAAPLGVFASGFSLGAGISLVVSGFIVSYFAGQPVVVMPLVGAVSSWQAVFIITGFPGLLAAFLAFALADPRKRGASTPVARPDIRTSTQSHLAKDFFRAKWKVLALTYGGFGWASFLFYALGGWTPAFLSRTFGLPASAIGLQWGLIVAVSGGLGALAGGVLIDRAYRAGVRDACLVVPIWAALIGVPFTAFGYLLQTPLLVLVSLGIGMTMVGIVSAGSFATWQKLAPPLLRGRVSAAFSFVAIGIGASLGPVVPAMITDYVLGAEDKVGWSLSITATVALLALASLLYAARSPLKRAAV